MSNSYKNPWPPIVGVVGKAGSGKDTLAGVIADQFEEESRRVAFMAFADPIKEMLGSILDSVFAAHDSQSNLRNAERALHNKAEKETPIPELNDLTPRQMLHSLGDWGKATFGEDIWVNLCAQYREKYYTGYTVMITDVRYGNEGHWILREGGIIVGVTSDTPTAGIPSHSSEAGLADRFAKFWVHNPGTLEGLEQAWNEEWYKYLEGDLFDATA